MDEFTDIDSHNDIHPAAALPIPTVEIVPFPDFNNLLPLMPEEFPPKELLGGLGDQGQNAPEHFQQNFQIGMVQHIQPSVDPIFGSLSSLGNLPTLGSSPQPLRY
jgi:hypothetical protein